MSQKNLMAELGEEGRGGEAETGRNGKGKKAGGERQRPGEMAGGRVGGVEADEGG